MVPIGTWGMAAKSGKIIMDNIVVIFVQKLTRLPDALETRDLTDVRRLIDPQKLGDSRRRTICLCDPTRQNTLRVRQEHN